MKLIKVGDEVYLEFTTTKDAVYTLAKLLGAVVFGLASFYSIWILLEFLK